MPVEVITALPAPDPDADELVVLGVVEDEIAELI
jgi:hypothetical protein